jgi:hypothetical protein
VDEYYGVSENILVDKSTPLSLSLCFQQQKRWEEWRWRCRTTSQSQAQAFYIKSLCAFLYIILFGNVLSLSIQCSFRLRVLAVSEARARVQPMGDERWLQGVEQETETLTAKAYHIHLSIPLLLHHTSLL